MISVYSVSVNFMILLGTDVLYEMLCVRFEVFQFSLIYYIDIIIPLISFFLLKIHS